MDNRFGDLHVATYLAQGCFIVPDYPPGCDSLSFVFYDGKIYWYDTTGMSLETFAIQVGVVFDETNVDAAEWGHKNEYRADIL